MDDELRRDQDWERDCVKNQQKKRKSGSAESDELPVAVQQEIEDLCYYVPEVTNHFNVLDKIGEGTFSSVFLASLKHPKDIKEKFALKHIVPTSHPNRMIAELRCLQLFGGKENVMGVELCLKNRDHVVIIMPYFPHHKFLEYFNTLLVCQVQDYMKNLLRALRYIHQSDVIHRDVKPTNFLHNLQTETYALVDFGLAQDAPVKLRAENEDRPPIISFSKPRETRSSDSPEKARPRERRGVGPRTAPTSTPPRKLTSPQSKAGPNASQSSQLASPRQSSPDKMGPGALPFPPPPLALPSRAKHRPGVKLEAKRSTTKDNTPAGRLGEKSTAMTTKATSHAARSRLSTVTAKDADKRRLELLGSGVTSPNRRGKQPVKASLHFQDSKKKRGGRNGTGKPDCQTKCRCYGRPSVCSFCTARPVENAHRAGTPGFRAPEVLMRHPHQSTAVDIWSAGVIFISLLSGRYPFFRGNDDLTCLSQILSLLGTESVKKAALSFDKLITVRPETRALDLKSLCERLRANPDDAATNKKSGSPPTLQWSEVPEDAVDLLARMLDPNPATRITAEQALASDFLAKGAYRF
ncbi:hypothetical protein ACOMHN_012616 [Nucella lapillus]